MLTILIPLAVSISAAGLIYDSWRNQERTPAASAGWMLAFASVYVWSVVLGLEFGITFAVITFICLVWAVIALTREAAVTVTLPIQRPFRALNRPGMQACLRHSALFMLSVPVAGVIAMMASVALVLYLPWTLPAKIAVVIFSYPVLWGSFSVWICAQDKLLRPALASATVFALSALILFS